MALPTTVIASTGIPGSGPRSFKSSGGNFYTLNKNTASPSNFLEMYKATDPTDSWTATDTANNPRGWGVALASCYQDSDVIHIVWTNGLTIMRYATFNMATDAWVIDESIETLDDAPTNPWMDVCVRPDGDVIAVYAGDTDQVMGGKKERVDVNIRSGGTWGGPTQLDANNDEHYWNPVCVNSNSTTNDVHIIWCHTAETADPPTNIDDYEGRTLRANDSLSTTVVDTTANNYTDLNNLQGLIAYDDAGTEKIGFGIMTAVSLTTGPFLEDGSNDLALPSGGTVVAASTTETPYVNGENTQANLVGPDTSGDIHLLWSNADDSQDIWYNKSTDGMDTWGTEAQELDAITCNFIHSNIYERGSDTVLAYVYDDGGTTKYNEKVLFSSGQEITLPVITSTATIHSPTIALGTEGELTLPHVSAATTIHSPTVAFGTEGELTLPLVTNTTTIYSPTIENVSGDQEVVLPAVTAATTIYGPTVVADQEITLAHVTNTAAIYQPTVALGTELTITLPVVSAATTIYSPTLSLGTEGEVTLPHVTATATIHAPSLALGVEGELTLPSVSASTIIYGPTVTSEQEITLPVVTASTAIYSPTVAAESPLSITLPLVTSSAVIHATTTTLDTELEVTLPHVVASTTIYSPTLTIEKEIILPVVNANTTIYSPTLTLGAEQEVTLPLVSNPASIHAPVVALDTALEITLPIVTTSAVIYGPSVVIEGKVVKEVQVEFNNDYVINTNGASGTFYFNGSNYYKI